MRLTGINESLIESLDRVFDCPEYYRYLNDLTKEFVKIMWDPVPINEQVITRCFLGSQ